MDGTRTVWDTDGSNRRNSLAELQEPWLLEEIRGEARYPSITEI